MTIESRSVIFRNKHSSHQQHQQQQQQRHYHSSITAVEQYVPINPHLRQHNFFFFFFFLRRMGKNKALAHHIAQQYSSTTGAGWDLHFFTILHPTGKSGSRPRGEAFHAPRSRSWDSSAVVSPGTPRADVWGGRGTGMRSLGAGLRAVERRVVRVLF